MSGLRVRSDPTVWVRGRLSWSSDTPVLGWVLILSARRQKIRNLTITLGQVKDF